ncbi:MAG: hypothetical protein CM15mV60_140 [uncultured marine virus]|nr:MAG: hypothetical protein CM15mV60_140 [uncultured marine virus]
MLEILEDPNPYNIARPQILRMVNDMRRMRLTNRGLFSTDERLLKSEGGEVESLPGLDINNYLLPEVQKTTITIQPMPNAQVFQPQAPGKIMATD